MSEIDRDHFISLLEKLGSDKDADVLEAAREVHRLLGNAGLSWDDVLEPLDDDEYEDDEDEDDVDDDDVEYEDEDDDEDDYDDDELDESEIVVEDSSEDLKRIEHILKNHKISEDTRDDLLDLKEDIADGEFTERDRRYVQALLTRLEGEK